MFGMSVVIVCCLTKSVSQIVKIMHIISLYRLVSFTYRPICTLVLYISIIPDCVMVLFNDVQCSVAVSMWCAISTLCVWLASLITIGSCACCLQHCLVLRAPGN